MNSIKRLTYKGSEVDVLLGSSKSARFSRENPKSQHYDPTWPIPVKLSARSTGYLVTEIEAWLASRPRARQLAQQEAK